MQFVQVMVFVDARLEILGSDVQVSEQIMRNGHFFTSLGGWRTVLTSEDSRLCAGGELGVAGAAFSQPGSTLGLPG
ncbi:hypothetical protein PAGU2196_38540 [Pseudomonas sp. PAGU 2196]|nr:hypothetical protein PAGU2196_38540 [Pseudomonas sp. PAGU 2196]